MFANRCLQSCRVFFLAYDKKLYICISLNSSEPLSDFLGPKEEFHLDLMGQFFESKYNNILLQIVFFQSNHLLPKVQEAKKIIKL